jgi:hypothetical protein
MRDEEKNDYTTQFFKYDIAELWEALPEFKKTYQDFKD